MANDLPNLIWVDCEMTGLDLSKDVLVEIAVLVTEADLTPLDDGIDVVGPECAVPLATCWTLRAISWVAAPCCSTAEAMVVEISLIWLMMPLICPIASTAPFESVWMA